MYVQPVDPSPTVVPSPSLTVAPHGPPSMQPTPSTTADSGGGGGGGDGQLPTTGPDALLMFLALVFLLVGVVVVAMAKGMRRT